MSSFSTRSRRKRMCEDAVWGDIQEVLQALASAPVPTEEIVRSHADKSTKNHKRRPRFTMGKMTGCQSQSQPQQPSLVSSHEQQPAPINPQCFQPHGSGDNNVPLRFSVDPIPWNPGHSKSSQPLLGGQEKPIEPAAFLPSETGGGTSSSGDGMRAVPCNPHSKSSQAQFGDQEQPVTPATFLPFETGDSISSSGDESDDTKKRTRGPTRCLSVWSRPAGMHKIAITTNKQHQPIGRKASKLSNFLGILARDGKRAPLTYVDWRAMPEANKEDIWDLIQSKFDIEPSAKGWVMKSLGKKWRDWKGKLKANHYYRWDTDEERLQDRDDRVLEEQWQALIKFWGSEKEKVRSMTNSRNRARLKFLHTAGTKSFARIREEERVKRPDGEEPDQTDMFIITRKRRDGGTLNEATAEVVSKLESETSKQQNPLQKSTTREEIFSQVMGEDRLGRAHTYGLGDLWGQTPSKAEALKFASEAKRANDELCKMRETMEAMMQKYAALETEHTAMKDQMASFFSTIMKQQPGVIDCQVLNNANDIPSSADRAAPSLKGASTSNVIGSSDQRYQKKRGKTNHGKKLRNS